MNPKRTVHVVYKIHHFRILKWLVIQAFFKNAHCNKVLKIKQWHKKEGKKRFLSSNFVFYAKTKFILLGRYSGLRKSDYSCATARDSNSIPLCFSPLFSK